MNVFPAYYRSIALCSFPAFVNKAVDLINTKGSACGSQISLTSRGPVRLGEQIASLVKGLALSSEVRYAKNRYGVDFSSLASKRTVEPLEIIKLALAVADTSLETQQLISEGMVGTAEKSRRAFQKFLNTEESRSLVNQALSRLEFDKLAELAGPFNKVASDILRLRLDTKTMTLEQFHEILTKRLSLGDLEEGMVIPLPKLVDPATGELSPNHGQFLVKKVVISKGLMAFALTPQDAPPFIKPTVLFRPTTHTQKNAFETLADDLSTCIGKRSFLSAKGALLKVLHDPEFLPSGQKAHMAGFSLGGAHAARLLATAPDKFEKAFFFNDPSTEIAVADEFAKNLVSSSHSCENPLEIDIYHTDKDLVTHAGEMHVGYIREGIDDTAEARSKCLVRLHRVITRQSEADPTRTLIPKIMQIATQSMRESLKLKGLHHTQITLSDFCDSGSSSPTSNREGSFASLDSPRSFSSEENSQSDSPRSFQFKKIETLSPRSLDRMTLEEVKLFNGYRLSAWKIRGFLQTICLLGQLFVSIKNNLYALGCYVFKALSFKPQEASFHELDSFGVDLSS